MDYKQEATIELKIPVGVNWTISELKESLEIHNIKIDVIKCINNIFLEDK